MGIRAFLIMAVFFLASGGWDHSLFGQSNPKAIIKLNKSEFCSGDTLLLTILNGDSLLAGDSAFFLSFRSLESTTSRTDTLSELHLSIPEGQFRIPLPDTFSKFTEIELFLHQRDPLQAILVWQEKAWINPPPEVGMDPFPKICLNAAPLVLDQGKPKGGRYWGSAVRDGKFHASELIPALFTIYYEYTSEEGCRNVAEGEVEVLPSPTVKDFPMSDSSFCLSDAPVELNSGKPKGGYFAGLGVGDSTFYPELAGPGKHRISYVIEQWGCTDSISVSFEVLPKPDFELPEVPPQCVGDDTIHLKAAPQGGYFTGKGVSDSSFYTRGLSQGTYTITYTLDEARCPASTSFEVSLISIQRPPEIESNGDSLWVSAEYTNLQWWLNEQLLPGQTRRFIRPEINGVYRVNIQGEGGCEAFSEPMEWALTPGIIEQRLLSEWSIFPNPAKDYAVINWRDHFEKNSEIRVYTSSGKLVKRQYLPEDSNVFVLEVGNWEAGIYIAKIKMGNINTQKKIVVKR